MQHDLQMRAAVRAHFAYAHPFGPVRFEDAEQRRTRAYRQAIDAAWEETAAIEELFIQERQGGLFEDMMGMTPEDWDRIGSDSAADEPTRERGQISQGRATCA
jgi:hypothetical protein